MSEKVVFNIVDVSSDAHIPVAVRTDGLFDQPLVNALLVELVRANRHRSDLHLFFEIVTANRTHFIFE